MTEKQMFDKHPKALFWSERNEKKPSDVALNSHKKFWFNCDCSHQFESTLLNINLGNNWCPYCSNHVMKLCSADYCKMCFNNSFASHEKAKYWSDENELTPRQVFKATDKKFYFNCECGHKIIMSLKKLVDVIIGVHIARIKNCVKMKIVIRVLQIRLLLLREVLIYMIKH